MQVVTQVFATTDYDLFKTLNGNRNVNALHVERLKASFKDKYLISPIIVNERYEIIDGQHRFKSAKTLGLPVNFIIANGYGLQEVQLLNSNMKNWKKEDYLKAYCDLGNNEYIKMRDFMRDFPDFGIAVSEQLLTNSVGGVNNRAAHRVDGKHLGKVRNFQNGNFVVSNLEMAYDNGHKIMMIKPYYNGFNRSVFVAAMITLFKNENYNHAQLVSKLHANPGSLIHCSNVNQYKLLIEEIYNFRSREKVSLRF